MKQSVGCPGRLASAQSVRTPLRRNASGSAENTLVSISRGGVSRYIIAWFHLSETRRHSINQHVDPVDVPRPHAVLVPIQRRAMNRRTFRRPPNALDKLPPPTADGREDHDMAHFGPTRRSLLQGTLAAGALGLSGFPARAEPQWKKYAGTTIEANLIKGPRGELLQKYASEFTDLTGIKVESEVIPEQQQRQKAVIELTSGKPSFDVIHVSYHVQKRQFEKAGWLADLTAFMNDPNLTAPDLRVDDFSAGGLQFAQNDKGEMRSLPWSVDYFILYWNKELFAKKGVTLPKTFDEMAVAAEKLNDPANGIYGFTGRGLRNANMTLWTNFFLNYGGEFLDAKGNILTD